MKYRYENHNRFPIVVPGKKGASVTFASGQGTNDEWYSRFVGNRSLSRVPLAGVQLPPGPAPQPMPAPVVPEVPDPPPLLEHIAGMVQETTVHWTKKNGIYYCKHCELFRTGSKAAIIGHLHSYHQLDVEAARKPKPPETVPEPSPPASVESATPAASVEKPEEPVREPVITGKVFPCPHCERKYKTEKGLGKHLVNVHGAPAPAPA